MTVSPQQAIDTVTSVFGRHPGFRALHAKGTLLGAFDVRFQVTNPRENPWYTDF